MKIARAITLALGSFLSRAALSQESTVEVEGQAPILSGDRVLGRQRALDEAMQKAVEQASQTLLSREALLQRSSDLRLRIYPRPGTFIANYRVLNEGELGGAPATPTTVSPATQRVFHIRIAAQVAMDRLARELSVEG